MVTKNEWRPRITVDISEELYHRVSIAFPHGTRNPVMVAAIEQITSAVEAGGHVVAYLIMNGKLKLFSELGADVKAIVN